MNKSHGSPYNRGASDSYYRRPREPHWYPAGSYVGKRISGNEMSDDEIDEYHLGYDENEADCNFKDYG